MVRQKGTLFVEDNWMPTFPRPHLATRIWRWLRFVAAAFAIFCILLLLARPWEPVQIHPYEPEASDLYYQRDTPSFFPPNPAHESEPCAGLPPQFRSDVQLVLKTGVGEIDRAEANLAAASSCFPNVLVVSDVDQQRAGRHFVDIIASLPPSYHRNNSDLDIYARQKAAIDNGSAIGYTHDAWKLDRFKFLPMIERAYRDNPNAKWYVFTEADVYIFWDSMLRLLHQYDPDEKHYLGNAVADANSRDFAYGGSSYAISHALMRDFLDAHDIPPSVEFEQLVRGDCCGDAVLSIALRNRTGARVKGLFPMFTGDDIFSLSLDKEKWCTALVSLHRAQVTVTEALWRWERTRPYTEEPLVWSDLLHYTHSFLRNESVREHWDNQSDEPAPESSRAHRSSKHCSRACSRDRRCLQFTYANGECRLGHLVKLGFAKKGDEGEYISGWDMDKLRALGFDAEDETRRACKHTQWRKAKDEQG